MDTNNQTDLQELREQMSLLHDKLDNQTIIDDNQIEKIPRVRVASIKAVSAFWLILAIVLLVLFDGFYATYYYALTHFDKVMNYAEKTIFSPSLDSILNLPYEQLTPEQQKRFDRMNAEKIENAKVARDSMMIKYIEIKELMAKDPDKYQKAMTGVRKAIYGGWMLMINILITLVIVVFIVAHIFNINVLKHGKIRENISSLTEQMRKVRKAHIVSCIVICLLLALLMPLILEFYEGMVLGWKIVLIALPALLALLELMQLTPLCRYKAVSYVDWGKVLYIRHTCDKIISRMEE
ncbi:MAG: hypothetical protein IJ776_01630 [Paludibacteraceae bacterium]|nr:hypothetical protein [Paludibacteraceae bacterium]